MEARFPFCRLAFLLGWGPAFQICLSQNVGIGLNVPQARLHIQVPPGWNMPVMIADELGQPVPFLILTGSGDLGVGVNIPQARVHVGGNLRIDGDFRPGGNPGNPGEVLVSQGVNISPSWKPVKGNGPAIASICLSPTQNYLQKWTGSQLCNSIVYDDGSGVAVGTSTPGGRLFVYVPGNWQDSIFAIYKQGAVSPYLVVQSNGNIGIGTGQTYGGARMDIRGQGVWFVEPGGNMNTINTLADHVAMVSDDKYTLNVYATGTNPRTPLYVRYEGNNPGSLTSGNSPVVEIDNYGKGFSLLVGSHHPQGDTAYAIRAFTARASKVIYASTATSTNNTHVIFAEYEGIGTTGNVAVYGKATLAGINNGTGVRGWGGWTGILGIDYNGQPDANHPASWAGYFIGSVRVRGDLLVDGNISKGGGGFLIDHPLDPENKFLYHFFVESPEMLNIYSGRVKTDSHGWATVQLPEYFSAVNRNIRYNLTVIGKMATAVVWKEVDSATNTFVIRTSEPHVEVSWMVIGERNDPWARANRKPPVVEKSPDEKGFYLHPELYGEPPEKCLGCPAERKGLGTGFAREQTESRTILSGKSPKPEK